MFTQKYTVTVSFDDSEVKDSTALIPYGQAFIESAMDDRIQSRPTDLVKSAIVDAQPQ